MKDRSEWTVCMGCKKIAQDRVQRDLVFISGKKRCPVCGMLTTLLFKKNGNGKVQRFPRTAGAGNTDDKKIIKLIEESCKNYDCPGEITGIVRGPVVTEYLFSPDKFTRVKKLKTLNEDLARVMEKESVAIRRVAGKAVMGIAVPNAERKQVLFNDVLKNAIEHRDDMELPVNFGLDSEGFPFVEDLASYPHLLVAGSTGSGKSVGLHGIILSLLAIRSPKELQFVLIDPKTIELFPYQHLPHVWQGRQPASDVYAALSLLKDVENEMRRRSNNLHALKADNIKTLNHRIKAEVAELRKQGRHDEAAKREGDLWPYIVVVIDEMSDLILTEKKEFITQIGLLAQMARAAGICIISATQRPDVTILPNKVKVNFLARACFKVPTMFDSKTVLAYKGAENLLGKGDMFLISPHRTGLQRIHVPLTTPEDRNKLLTVSIRYGHVNRVPADAMDKKNPDLDKLFKEIQAQEQKEAAAAYAATHPAEDKKISVVKK